MIRGALTIAALLTPSLAAAAPALGPAYGSNMVLQRGQPIALEGSAAAGETVTVVLGDATARSKADAAGHFSLTLPAQAASSSPVALTLTDGSGTTRYDNLLIGDVFLCSGQSNMELTVNRALDAWNQLRLAPDAEMRLLMVPKTTAATPAGDFPEPVVWQEASRDSVAEFSAACFYMAKELRRMDPSVPVGLIHSNWGGSSASAWMTPESVGRLYGQETLAQLQTYARDPFAATQDFVPQWFDWWRTNDEGREPWTDSSMLDWKPIPQFSFWNDWKGTGLDTNPRANVWLRQTFSLTAEQAMREGALSIGAIDDLDLTFVNGRPIGYTFGWGVERTYRVPADYLHEGVNEVLIAANNMWDTGGFFAGPERLFYQPGPDGAPIPLGADWEYSISAIKDMPPRAPWDANAGLGVMHNAMIAPLGPMKLAGVAWYQGEADVGQPDYDVKLRELFAGWRRQFGPQTKMLVVQLADFGARVVKPVDSAWARLRHEQMKAVQSDPNAALVTAIDIGEPNDIHPANKNDLGKRLAHAYAGEKMPMPQGAVFSDDKVTVTFDGIVGALVAQSGPYPLSMELCGEDQKSCRYVLAELAGNRMSIPVPEGFLPVRVRHGWSDAPIINLYDERGMPVPGFELEIER